MAAHEANIQKTDEQLDDFQKEKLGQSLCIASGIMMTAVTMVVPTRAPMVLKIKQGDAAATARAMGSMSAMAAVIELIVNPVLSKLSDEFGRKPFLLMAPMVNAFLHSLVAILPGSLATQFIDRMISGSMIFGFAAPLNAGLADLFGKDPKKLGAKIADAGAYFGLGCTLGPFLGSKLGGAKSFLASALMFVVTTLYVQTQLSETLPLENRKKFKAADINPVLFLKLFKTRTLRQLTLTSLLQSFGDYMNIYDINNLFMIKVLKYGQNEIGNFATMVGATQIAGGKFTSALIKKTNLKFATAFSNLMWIIGMSMMANARNTTQAFAALFVWTFGHQRTAPVTPYIQKYGAADGLGRAEIVGAQGNLTAWAKVGVPLFYSNLFAFFTSNGRDIPGIPYYAICMITAVAQLVFQDAAPNDD